MTTTLLPLLLRNAGAGCTPAFLSCHGLSAEAAASEALRLAPELLAELSEALAELSTQPDLGLSVGRTLPRGALGLFEFYARTAPTLRQAMQDFSEYGALLGTEARLERFERGGCLVLERCTAAESLQNARQLTELALSALLRVLREATQKDLVPERVWFAHRAPRDDSALVKFFGTSRLEFGVRTSGFSLAKEALDLAIPGADPALRIVLRGLAESTRAELPEPTDFLGSVRDVIRRRLDHHEEVSVVQVAKALYLSSRTLQRRLQEHQVSFQEVLDGVRECLAKHLLARSEVTQGEVTYQLGFSEQAAFTRAFRRWTGMTPGSYRAQALTPETVAIAG